MLRSASKRLGLQARPVPKGFEIRYTRNGEPFLERVEPENNDDDESAAAAAEYRRRRLPFFASSHKLRERYGLGIFLYFDFMKFLAICNGILLALGLVSTVWHFLTDGAAGLAFGGQMWRAFYVTSFSHGNLYLPWLISTACAVGAWFLFCPLYAWHVKRVFQSLHKEDNQDQYAVDDSIRENKLIRRSTRVARFIFSYLLSAVGLLVSNGIAFVLVVAEQNASTDRKTFVTYLLITLLLNVSNFVWKYACLLLTRFERHSTMTSFRIHNLLKYYVFKMVNVTLMYGVRFYVSNHPGQYGLPQWAVPIEVEIPFDNEEQQDTCGLNAFGDQSLLLLLSDLTVGAAIEVMWPVLYKMWADKAGETGPGSNDSVKMEFDLSEEYLELLYRQFITLMGSTVVPVLPVVTLIVNAIEYPLDKMILLRWCQEPRRHEGSMKVFVISYMFTTALFAALAYPFGAVWVLIGNNFAGACTNSVYS